MAIVPTFPFKNLPISAKESKWFAAHNPLIVEIQRQDLTIVDCHDDGTGKVAIKFTALISPTPVFDDYIYLNSGIYVGIYKVLTIISSTVISIELDYVSTTTGGFANFNSGRIDYRVRIEFKKQDPISGLYDIDLGSGQYTPGPTGFVKADVSRFLKNAVTMVDGFNYDVINKKDTNISANLSCAFIETWTGIDEEKFEHITGFSTVNSAMQPMNSGGSNLKKFITEYEGKDIALWLTDFERPTFWVDFPFDLQFINSELMSGVAALKQIEIVHNANGSTSTPQHTLDKTLIGYVNRMKLGTTYSTSAIYTQIRLTDGVGTFFTQYLTIDIVHCTPKNPVYLKWIGPNGAWNYWCFGVTQVRGLNQKAGAVFTKFWSDLEQQTDTGRFIGKDTTPELDCGGEHIPTNKMSGLETLLGSPQVEMYVGWINEVHVWSTVRVSKFKYNKISKHNRHKIELTLDLLDVQTQTQ